VAADQVDLRDKRYQQHRCYKLVIHVNCKLDFLFVVAAVVSGRRHECPILYELVEEVVQAVHKGVMKVLIVGGGLIDGERMGQGISNGSWQSTPSSRCVPTLPTLLTWISTPMPSG
jgi:hypothetical protein